MWTGLLAAALAVPAPAQAAEPATRARAVVLMIGDGTGLGQWSAAMVAGRGRLQIERFPVVGLLKTYASDALITDSAASATAYATGAKTYNGAIGVDDQKRRLQTILELAQKADLGTGLVATCSLTHATPAAFAAHQPRRGMQHEIAADIATTAPDVLIGGGRRFFVQRPDARDLLAEMRRAGYAIVEDAAQVGALSLPRIAALVADEHLPKLSDGRGDYLPRAAGDALRILGRRNGFFLMIEGSQIDWGAHDNDAPYAIAETLDFDAAIGKVLDWAAADGRTLVVVTGDHETGGMSVNGGALADGSVRAAFTTKGHTAALIPVFAYGPGAAAFAGIHDNTAVFHRMKAALGL
ncbi:MAG: alkaline phosphatase [Vicinamibacteria bacterium]